jgi:hypothetical protein
MRRLMVMVSLWCSIATVANAQTYEDYQLTCGDVRAEHSLVQYGTSMTADLIVRTLRNVNICPMEVQAEGWIDGIAHTASTHRNVYTAQVRVIAPVPNWGRYHSEGKHWMIWLGHQWYNMGTTRGDVDIQPPPPQNPPVAEYCSPPVPDWYCGGEFGGVPSENGCYCIQGSSPILVDTAGDGYSSLTSRANGVRFDLDGDGTPEQISWTRPGSDEAWLALDRNGNGRIDNGTELFGNVTPVGKSTATNGFVALKFTEGPESPAGPGGKHHSDGVIDARDAVYSSLVLWRDRNHNGLSEPEELASLSSAGLMRIGTESHPSKRKDRHGNLFALRAKSWWTVDDEGGPATVTRPVYDVFLLTR